MPKKTNLIKAIPNIINEINAYHSHGLFKEARKRCRQLGGLVHKSKKLKNREKLLAFLSAKIKRIDLEAREFEKMGGRLKCRLRIRTW